MQILKSKRKSAVEFGFSIGKAKKSFYISIHFYKYTWVLYT